MLRMELYCFRERFTPDPNLKENKLQICRLKNSTMPKHPGKELTMNISNPALKYNHITMNITNPTLGYEVGKRLFHGKREKEFQA